MRLIDADAMKKLVKEFRDDAPQSSVMRYVCNVILSMLGDENQTPTIEAEPVRHGRWKKKVESYHDTHTGEYWEEEYFSCSICWKASDSEHNYCPNCGTKMDKEAEK